MPCSVWSNNTILSVLVQYQRRTLLNLAYVQAILKCYQFQRTFDEKFKLKARLIVSAELHHSTPNDIHHKKQTPCARFKLVLIWSVFTLVLHTTTNTMWHASNNFDKFIFIAVIIVGVKCVQHGVDHKHIEHLFDVCLCVDEYLCRRHKQFIMPLCILIEF